MGGAGAGRGPSFPPSVMTFFIMKAHHLPDEDTTEGRTGAGWRKEAGSLALLGPSWGATPAQAQRGGAGWQRRRVQVLTIFP